MTGTRTAFLGITLLILVLGALSTSTIFADGPTKISAFMEDLVNGGTPGVATIVVTDDNGKVTVQVRTAGLEPNHVHSVWWKHPAFEKDDGSGNLKGFNLAGGMSGEDGTGNFTGQAEIGNADPSLLIIIIKDHGEVLPGEVPDQKTTSKQACNSPPGNCPEVQKTTANFTPSLP